MSQLQTAYAHMASCSVIWLRIPLRTSSFNHFNEATCAGSAQNKKAWEDCSRIEKNCEMKRSFRKGNKTYRMTLCISYLTHISRKPSATLSEWNAPWTKCGKSRVKRSRRRTPTIMLLDCCSPGVYAGELVTRKSPSHRHLEKL